MTAAAAALCLTGSLAGCGVRGPLYYPVIPPLPAAPASQPPEDMPKTALDGGKLDVTPHPQAKPAAPAAKPAAQGAATMGATASTAAASAIAPAAGSESATSPAK